MHIERHNLNINRGRDDSDKGIQTQTNLGRHSLLDPWLRFRLPLPDDDCHEGQCGGLGQTYGPKRRCNCHSCRRAAGWTRVKLFTFESNLSTLIPYEFGLPCLPLAGWIQHFVLRMVFHDYPTSLCWGITGYHSLPRWGGFVLVLHLAARGVPQLQRPFIKVFLR